MTSASKAFLAFSATCRVQPTAAWANAIKDEAATAVAIALTVFATQAS